MRRVLAGLLLLLASAAAWSGDDCAGKVTASVLTHDRQSRQGAGLLINHCGRPVRAELIVVALNNHGFPMARLRTEVQANAAPMSILKVDLPFVQSVVQVSGYSTEVAAIETLEITPRRTARVPVRPAPRPL